MTTVELKTKLNASLEHLKSALSGIRVGRATTSLVEEIFVEAYDSKMMIKELGSITTPDANLIIITPWDKGQIKEIDKAIRAANLGLNPVPDSLVVKVPVPPLTEDRRKEFTKLATERVEEAKNSMRNVRQEAMKAIDKLFAEKLATEDEKFTQRDEVEKIVREMTDKVEEMGDLKKKELMTV
ncbi:MAG: ribosome recycling factor [Patescibacteria group bacterium]